MEDEGFYAIDQILAEEGLLGGGLYVQSAQYADELRGQNSTSNKDMTLEQRGHVVQELLSNLKNDKVPHGFQKKLAEAVGVHKSTISRLFRDIKNQKERGEVIDVRCKKVGRCGPKSKEYSDEFLQSVPLHLRTTIRAFAGALRVSHMVVHRLLKAGKLRSHSSTNHPRVTEDHKIARMKWALQHIHPGSNGEKAEFDDMRNVIHIDEKWFYLNPDKRRFILLPKEDDPYRCQQSKRYKIKVMFMAVISRPLYDVNGVLIHDGKFGIYPIVTHECAKKTSKNRVAGTIETKAVQNVTQVVTRKLLIEKVIPDIMAKWPAQLSKEIYIQQDNARPHIDGNDADFRAAATANGFDIKLIFQPPQSPDLNVLDLGLFNGFQSIQYHSFPKTIDELIERVEEAYEWYEPTQIRNCWLTLQSCMVEILKVKGCNRYKIPHMGKDRLERMGMLPDNVTVDQAIVDEAVMYLNARFIQVNNLEELEDDGMVVDQD